MGVGRKGRLPPSDNAVNGKLRRLVHALFGFPARRQRNVFHRRFAQREADAEVSPGIGL